MDMTLQIEQQIKSNEDIIANVLRLKEQLNRPVTFRDLMTRLPNSIDAEDIWDVLRTLQKATMIESIKISNKKSAWQIQHWYREKRDRLKVEGC